MSLQQQKLAKRVFLQHQNEDEWEFAPKNLGFTRKNGTTLGTPNSEQLGKYGPSYLQTSANTLPVT